jgi:hypothetical protein
LISPNEVIQPPELKTELESDSNTQLEDRMQTPDPPMDVIESKTDQTSSDEPKSDTKSPALLNNVVEKTPTTGLQDKPYSDKEFESTMASLLEQMNMPEIPDELHSQDSIPDPSKNLNELFDKENVQNEPIIKVEPRYPAIKHHNHRKRNYNTDEMMDNIKPSKVYRKTPMVDKLDRNIQLSSNLTFMEPKNNRYWNEESINYENL